MVWACARGNGGKNVRKVLLVLLKDSSGNLVWCDVSVAGFNGDKAKKIAWNRVIKLLKKEYEDENGILKTPKALHLIKKPFYQAEIEGIDKREHRFSGFGMKKLIPSGVLFWQADESLQDVKWVGLDEILTLTELKDYEGNKHPIDPMLKKFLTRER
ncbi:MAG: hypothetical protein UW09_C0002G0161 [candidate division TM6 bacterium GW2011_GWF2_43_87]|nr:MAG: hypothetical protein UW09_C0002G0161 [candidate division TM6 bacterium GW2011_GWF2_43_87]